MKSVKLESVSSAGLFSFLLTWKIKFKRITHFEKRRSPYETNRTNLLEN